jgi:hypothetical protein
MCLARVPKELSGNSPFIDSLDFGKNVVLEY